MTNKFSHLPIINGAQMSEGFPFVGAQIVMGDNLYECRPASEAPDNVKTRAMMCDKEGTCFVAYYHDGTGTWRNPDEHDEPYEAFYWMKQVG